MTKTVNFEIMNKQKYTFLKEKCTVYKISCININKIKIVNKQKL